MGGGGRGGEGNEGGEGRAGAGGVADLAEEGGDTAAAGAAQEWPGTVSRATSGRTEAGLTRSQDTALPMPASPGPARERRGG